MPVELRIFDRDGIGQKRITDGYSHILTYNPYTTLRKLEPNVQHTINTGNFSVLMADGRITYGDKNRSIEGGALLSRNMMGLQLRLESVGVLLQTDACLDGMELSGVKAIEKHAARRYLDYTKNHLKVIVGERKDPLETRWEDGNWSFTEGESGIRKTTVGNRLDRLEFSMDNTISNKGLERRDFHTHSNATEIYVGFDGISGMISDAKGPKSLTEMDTSRSSAFVAVVHPGARHMFLPMGHANVLQVSTDTIFRDKTVTALGGANDSAIRWEITEFIRKHSQSG